MLIGRLRPFTASYTPRARLRIVSEPTRSWVKRKSSKLFVPLSSGGNNNLGDEMLDFLYAGKKLRKWYGQEGPVLPRDGELEQEEFVNEEDEDDLTTRDAVLVLEADTNPMAEQVLLQLILARADIQAVVRDVGAAKTGYGPYVQATGGNSNDPNAVRMAARKKVKTIVMCGQVFPSVMQAAALAGVQHVVLLSAVGLPKNGGFQLFKNNELDVLKDQQREAIVRSSRLKYTIVRINGLINKEGGQSALKPVSIDDKPQTPLAREDAALIVAQAALRDITSENSLEFGIETAGPGQPPSEWPAFFQEILSLGSTR
jgi:hypothetical protein